MKTEFSPVQSVQVITHGEPPHMTAGQKESADGIPIGSEHCLRIFEKNKKKTALNGVQKGGHSLNTLTIFLIFLMIYLLTLT